MAPEMYRLDASIFAGKISFAMLCYSYYHKQNPFASRASSTRFTRSYPLSLFFHSMRAPTPNGPSKATTSVTTTCWQIHHSFRPKTAFQVKQEEVRGEQL